MNTLSRINSPSIDIEDFINGMSWDNAAEVQINLAALANGIRLLHEAILKNLVVPEAVDFNLLTRNLQASDPMLKIYRILEDFLTTQTPGQASRFKEIAADLSLLREILAGLVKFASDEAGKEVRANGFKIYLELLPKIHAGFVAVEDALLRWKATVVLEQQVDFVARLLVENENIAESGAMLAWGNDYLSAISPGGAEGKKGGAGAREIASILASLKSHYLQLLQHEIKREVEFYEAKIVLNPPTHENELSGLSEIIFRARKEAEEGAKFRLTLDFQVVPVAASTVDRSGPLVPVRPIHLRQSFETSYMRMDEIRKLIDGFVSSLQEEVNNGDFKGQDSQSLTGWFTDSFVPWVQTDDVVKVAH